MERHAHAGLKPQPAPAPAPSSDAGRSPAPARVPTQHTGEDLIETLQRTAGNRAVVNLLSAGTPVQRQTPPPVKPAPLREKATFEEIVQEMQGLGGPYKDLEAWKAAIKPGKFLGHELRVWNQTTQGVHPDFQTKLDAAKTTIDKEFADAKKTPPKGYGIVNVGGFRNEISPHGAGVAIDIDASKNPYIMHVVGKKTEPVVGGKPKETETAFDAEVRPVYNRIAAFMLNEPVGSDDSIIPNLIKSDTFLPGSAGKTRRDRLVEYYDRLLKESDAMKEYFRLMRDEAALKAFIAGDWKTKHPKETVVPAVEATVKQMWQDYALLGGKIPKEISQAADWVAPTKRGRPYDDPAAGFLTIPKEVVVGLGQEVKRWGAIDFQGESGDVMHFDDRTGLGKPFYDAKDAIETRLKAAAAKQKADEKAAAKAAKEAAKAAKAGSGSGSGSGTGSGSTPAPTPTSAPTSAPAPATQKLQRSVASEAVVQRDTKDPWRRTGEAWPYGPISARKSATHPLATYIGWIKDVERGYGPDKQMVLQRLRRLHYSGWSGKAGAKFDKVIETIAGAEGEPLTIPQAPAAAVDGLYETDNVVTPDGKTLDPGHILAALDLKVAGSSWKAEMGEVAAGTTMLGVLTWAGDLASWWLEWVTQAKKIHEAPRPEPTGPATDEGPPDERGGDPAMDIGLWETIGRSKASKEDLLGDMDAQVLAQTSTRKSTAESVKREKRIIRDANIGTELTAPVSKLLEDYYGTSQKAAATAPSANRFASFVRLASPRIPFQEGESGNVPWMQLAPDAEEEIRKAVENVAFLFVGQGTSMDPHETLRTSGFRIKDIAKRFAAFLNEGLKNGDAAWL
ncbi:MAG TPA: hypothetical protein VGQ64_04750 [Candidatus Limnocylindrales bacterium]|nr:hypothetical protein [Candidatus Limnocylindrales bacterium]